MKILIYGAGAVGSLFGGLLAKAGHAIDLLGRSWHMDVIKQQGLKISGIWGNHHIKTLGTYTEVSQISSQKYDLILLTVKSFDTLKSVQQIQSLMTHETTLISFQNGLGNTDIIQEYIPKSQWILGRIITGVDLEPGHIQVTVTADDMVVGNIDSVQSNKTPEEFARICNGSQIPCRAVDNIMNAIWLKALYNCALNGPCSVHEIPYGELLNSAELWENSKGIIKECYLIANALGVGLIPKTHNEYVQLLKDKLIPVTAKHFPSMLADIKRGRKTEINHLNGAISRWGKQYGIPTPQNDEVTAQITQLENKS